MASKYMSSISQNIRLDQYLAKEGRRLDLINRPRKSDICITPNRAKVFRKFNYSFTKESP